MAGFSAPAGGGCVEIDGARHGGSCASPRGGRLWQAVQMSSSSLPRTPIASLVSARTVSAPTAPAPTAPAPTAPALVALAALALPALFLATGCGDDGAAPADAAPACVAAPMVAGSGETDALANAPARCGATSYAWRRDATLGSVTERSARTEYSAEALAALAQAGNVALPSPPVHDVAMFDIGYETQDHGARVTSSTAVAFPTDLAAGESVPLLLLLHGTSGFRRGCGPTADASFKLLGGLLASYGWVVATPDYLGLESLGDDYAALHPYLVGEATALASLDAARAAQRLASESGVCARPELAALGGSQGGHAALWVDRLAPYYARELTLLGTVATVPPSDLVAHTDRALRSVVPATANTIALLAGMAPWYGASGQLDQVFVPPYLTSIPAALEASCDPGSAVDPGALSDVFTSALLDHVAGGSVATYPTFGCMIGEASLVDTSVARITAASASYGILFVLGESDTLVDPAIERASYDGLCAGGMPLSYLECTGASHTQATLWALPEILDFLAARREHQAFTPACTRPAAATCRGTP
jgi:hypothetical protein